MHPIALRRNAVCLAILGLSLSACSDLVGGLHVSEGDAGKAYYIVPAGQAAGADNSRSHAREPYEIVPVTPKVVIAQAKAARVAELNPGKPPLANYVPGSPPVPYHVGPLDQLSITVWDHPELSASGTSSASGASSSAGGGAAGGVSAGNGVTGLEVQPDGTVFFPTLGSLKVAGMTTDDIRDLLVRQLAVTIRNPQVSVDVVAYRAYHAQVTGSVGQPGLLPLDSSPVGVLQAIDARGGLTTAASHRRAVLLRKGVGYLVDTGALLSGATDADNPLVQSGDEIRVPDQSADVIYLLGDVANEKPLPLQQAPMNLLEAVDAGGGIDKIHGKAKGILVFRSAPPGSKDDIPTVFVVDLSTAAGVLLATQFNLQPHDVVYVKTTKFGQLNSVVNQVLPTVSTLLQAFQINRLVQ